MNIDERISAFSWILLCSPTEKSSSYLNNYLVLRNAFMDCNFNTTLRGVLEYHLESKKGKQRVNFFAVDAEDVNGVIRILEKIRFIVEQHGEILFLNHAYNQYGRRIKSVQCAYFFGPDSILAVFVFKGMDYHNSPLVWAARKKGI